MDQTQIPLDSHPPKPVVERDLAHTEPQSEEGRLLRAIYLSTERTRKMQVLQTWLTFVMAAFLGVFVIGSVILANRLMPVVTNLAGEMETLAVQTTALVQSLSETDFTGLVNSTKAFVDSSSENAQQALDKINSIDIQTLNESIRALYAIVTPMARLFGR